MNITAVSSSHRRMAGAILCLAFAGCGGSVTSASPVATAGSQPTIAAESEVPTSPSAESSQAPDVGGGTTSGDVPDNAVFLTYHQAALSFSIQYVEGWQVTTRPDGVLINDKDSSEAVTGVGLPSDVAAYISGTDLPALNDEAGFSLVKQDSVKVGGATYRHLVYHILSPADPVTGKQVPSTVDRYYVPGLAHLASVSMSTPDGVDNVDAFRQMIESFAWG